MKIKLTFVDKNNGKTKRIILSDTDGDSLEVIRKHLESTPSNWDARINIFPELGRLTTEGMPAILHVIEYRLDKGDLSIPCMKELIDIHDNLRLARHTLGNHEDTLKQMMELLFLRCSWDLLYIK